MADSKASAELIRQLRKKGYVIIPYGKNRAKVVLGKDGKGPSIPGPKQRIAGGALANVKTKLRNHGIDI